MTNLHNSIPIINSLFLHFDRLQALSLQFLSGHDSVLHLMLYHPKNSCRAHSRVGTKGVKQIWEAVSARGKVCTRVWFPFVMQLPAVASNDSEWVLEGSVEACSTDDNINVELASILELYC